MVKGGACGAHFNTAIVPPEAFLELRFWQKNGGNCLWEGLEAGSGGERTQKELSRTACTSTSLNSSGPEIWC